MANEREPKTTIKEREQKRLYKSMRDGLLSRSHYSNSTIKKLLSTYEEELYRQFKIEFVRKNTKNISIIKNVLIKSNLDVKKIAIICITTVLNKVCVDIKTGAKYNHLCQAISNSIQKEIIYQKLLSIPDARMEINRVRKNLKNKNSLNSKIGIQLYKNHIKIIEEKYQAHTTLDPETKAIIGSYLLHILVKSTSIVKIEEDRLSDRGKKSSLPKRVCRINKAYLNEILRIVDNYTNRLQSLSDNSFDNNIIIYKNDNGDNNDDNIEVECCYSNKSDIFLENFNIERDFKEQAIKDNPTLYYDAIKKADNIKYQINSDLFNYIDNIITFDIKNRKDVIFNTSEYHSKPYINRDILKSPVLRSYHNSDEKMNKIKKLRSRSRVIKMLIFNINKSSNIESIVPKNIQNTFYKLFEKGDRENAIKLFEMADELYDALDGMREYKEHYNEYRNKVIREIELIKKSRDAELSNTILLRYIKKNLINNNKNNSLCFSLRHKIDFRGRLYTLSNFLSYQSNDLNRGMIQYNNSSKIKTINNFSYLIYQLSNHYGIKGTKKELVKWFFDNIDNIINLFYFYNNKTLAFDFSLKVNNFMTPIDFDFKDSPNNTSTPNYDKDFFNYFGVNPSRSSVDLLKNCKDKIQFLSFAQHIARIYKRIATQNKSLEDVIKDYEMNNVFYFDACNSALQHSGLLINDYLLLKYTNINNDNDDEINDVYIELLKMFKEKANSRIVNDLISRSDVKKFCMTVVYNSKQISVKESFFYMLKEKLDNSQEHYNLIQDNYFRFLNKISNLFVNVLFYDFSNDAFKGINKSKLFIQDILLSNKENTIKNDLNFNLNLNYYKGNYKEIKYNLNQEFIRVYVKDQDKKIIDKNKMRNSFNANYIHFKDAEHLVRVINEFDKDITTIHDCFGCSVEDCYDLNYTVRKCLYDMYGNEYILSSKYSFF